MVRIANWLKKYFIPHEENDHRPHFLRHRSILLTLLLVILIQLGLLVQVFVIFDQTKFLAAVLPGVLVNLTNEERLAHGVPPLSTNPLLEEAARLKAEDMANRGYFAHVSPDGKTPWYWLNQVGYAFTRAGENLAVNFSESTDVGRAWMNSPGHRANIIKENYEEIGIAVANGLYQGRPTIFVAQFFGTPIKVARAETLLSPETTVEPTPQITNTPRVEEAVVTNIPASPESAPDLQVLGGITLETPTETSPGNLQPDEETISSAEVPVPLFVQKALTTPRYSANYVYAAIAFITIVALLLAIFIKTEIQHFGILARGMFLIAIIGVLMYFNLKVLNFETIVPANSLQASVIIAN